MRPPPETSCHTLSLFAGKDKAASVFVCLGEGAWCCVHLPWHAIVAETGQPAGAQHKSQTNIVENFFSMYHQEHLFWIDHVARCRQQHECVPCVHDASEVAARVDWKLEQVLPALGQFPLSAQNVELLIWSSRMHATASIKWRASSACLQPAITPSPKIFG